MALNLKKVGSLVKAESPDVGDWYFNPNSYVINILTPQDGTANVIVQIGAQQFRLSAITDIQIDGVAVTDQADFETQIATVFNVPGGSGATTLDELTTKTTDDDIEITNAAKGIILRTAEGTRARVTLTDDGDGTLRLTITEL